MHGAPKIRFFKERQGNAVAYAVHGDGPLVICPAWWISHVERDWTHKLFRDFIERLGDGLSLVRYDRPGVGLSDPATGALDLEAEANLLADLVAELDADRYSLFAMSCGGPTAIAHASRHADDVERLCLYGAYADGRSLCSKDVEDAVLATVEAHWGMGSRAMADIFYPDADRETLDAFARYQRESTDAGTAADLLRLTYSMDARPFLEDVKAETLVIHRREDRAIPFTAGRALAAGIDGARLITLDGRAHPPWIDGDEIARIANGFLRGEDMPAMSSPAVPPTPCRLDVGNRCLVIAGERVALTPLEFAVMAELTAAPDRLITRDHLLAEVWRQPYEGSNRIDSLMRSLRRKLGAYAPSIETVIGHGYRFVGWRTKQDDG